MKSAKEKIIDELSELVKEYDDLNDSCKEVGQFALFGTKYQNWYTRAIKIVEVLAPDRFKEFKSYYEIDPKRKFTEYSNYVIQDYVKGVDARRDHNQKPLFDVCAAIRLRLLNQIQILNSLRCRIDGVLADVEGALLAGLEDAELDAASRLKKVSLRAAGALAGVVLERHLQRVAVNHAIQISKANPTISDLNDPLKQGGVYDQPTWRKIQLLADLRNICSHSKAIEPTSEQVDELISGVNIIVKSIV